LKSPTISFSKQLNTHFLSPTCWPRELGCSALLCSGTCESGSLFKGVCPGTAFHLQQLADISIADLAIPASAVAWAQPWNILYSFIIWETASAFLWRASHSSKTRMELKYVN